MKTVIVFPGYNGYGILIDEELVGCFTECIAKSIPIKVDDQYASTTTYTVAKEITEDMLPKVRFVSDDRIIEEVEPETITDPEVEPAEATDA